MVRWWVVVNCLMLFLSPAHHKFSPSALLLTFSTPSLQHFSICKSLAPFTLPPLQTILESGISRPTCAWSPTAHACALCKPACFWDDIPSLPLDLFHFHLCPHPLLLFHPGWANPYPDCPRRNSGTLGTWSQSAAMKSPPELHHEGARCRRETCFALDQKLGRCHGSPNMSGTVSWGRNMKQEPVTRVHYLRPESTIKELVVAHQTYHNFLIVSCYQINNKYNNV